jgi:hypothetical protein
MALIGGGGAGNVGGGSAAGSSTNFQTLGNSLYAYSGGITSNDSSLTSIFQDRSPQDASYLLKCYVDIGSNAGYTIYLDLNGVRVGNFFVNGDEAYPSTSPFELIVPNDTDVNIQVLSVSGTPTHYVRIIGEQL